MFCVCVSLSTFEPNSRFYEIQQEGHATEGDLNATTFNPAASTIKKWWTFKLLIWMQNLHQCGTLKFCKLIDLQRMDYFQLLIFVKSQKQLNVNIHTSVLWRKLMNVALVKYGEVKDQEYTYRIYVNHYFLSQ
jgi:hypothetical protein